MLFRSHYYICKEVRTVSTAEFLQGELCVYLDRRANRSTGLGVDGEGSALTDSGVPTSPTLQYSCLENPMDGEAW